MSDRMREKIRMPIRREADAAGARIEAAAYSKDVEFYELVRSLELYEKSIHEDDRIVLSLGSKLLRHLSP